MTALRGLSVSAISRDPWFWAHAWVRGCYAAGRGTVARGSYPERVKTRTLLLLAVGCGLIILVAGSIKVFLIADDTAPSHLHVGESATIGDMRVTVSSTRRTTTQTLVEVELQGVDDEDGARSFVLGTGSKQLEPVDPPAGEGEPCGATSAGRTISCVLAFDTADAAGVLRYERAGETLRWDIVAPAP